MLLALLRTAAQEDDESVTVLAKVNAVAWAEIELVFEDPGPDALNIREIPKRDPGNRGRYLRRSLGIQIVEPFGVLALTFAVEIFSDLNDRR